MSAVADAIKRSRVTLDVDRPVVARKAFTSHGRRFERGEVYPWRLFGVHVSKLRNLFCTGFVINAPAVEMRPDTMSEPPPIADRTPAKAAGNARDQRSAGHRPRA